MTEAIHSLIDINELSRRLSVPKGTLYNWVYLKRIPFIKAGRSLRFDPVEVIESLPHYAKSEKAGLRDDEWRTLRGA
jgi:excisionase family DNA binding protein